MRESEDHVEFKKGEHGNVSYNGAGKDKPQGSVSLSVSEASSLKPVDLR